MYAEKTYLASFDKNTIKLVDYTVGASSQNPEVMYVKMYTMNGYTYEEIASIIADGSYETITIYDMVEVAPVEYDSNPVLKPIQRLVGFNKNPLITYLPENGNYEITLFLESSADEKVKKLRAELDMLEMAIL